MDAVDRNQLNSVQFMQFNHGLAQRRALFKIKNETSLQIYARVRGRMPWEPQKVSLKVAGQTVQNKAGKIANE